MKESSASSENYSALENDNTFSVAQVIANAKGHDLIGQRASIGVKYAQLQEVADYGLDRLFQLCIDEKNRNDDEIISMMAIHVTRLLDATIVLSGDDAIEPKLVEFGLDRKLQTLIATENISKEAIVSDIIDTTRVAIENIYIRKRNKIEAISKKKIRKWDERRNWHQTPPEFIKETYKAYLGNGLTQADIKRVDAKLYRALYNWLRNEKNSVLDSVNLPPRAEGLKRKATV